jgi:hypothetical protein
MCGFYLQEQTTLEFYRELRKNSRSYHALVECLLSIRGMLLHLEIDKININYGKVISMYYL